MAGLAVLPGGAEMHRRRSLAGHSVAPHGFELLAVAMSYDPPEYVRDYTKQNQLPFKVVLDSDGSIAAARNQVALTPTAVLIDKKGRLLCRVVGKPDFVALPTLIDQEFAE